MKIRRLFPAIGVAAALGLMVSSAFAHSAPPSKGAKFVNGTLCTYVAGKSATVAAPTSTCAGATISLRLNRHTKLVDENNPAAAIATGDAVAAFLEWKSGKPSVNKLEYGAMAFIFRHALFSGTFVSWTGTCPTGVLVVKTQGKKGADASFNADANTAWESGNAAATCDSVTAALKANKSRLNVTGGQLTDNTWHANMVNANPA